MLTAETQEIRLLFLYFDMFYSCPWIFFFFFTSSPFPSRLLQLLILLVLLNLFKFLRIFFFLNHTFCFFYILLSLYWAFCGSVGFSFLFFFFF